MLPNYAGGSLVNLMASIVDACGGAVRHETLAALPPQDLAAATNVVLLIVDGLGERYLMRRGAGGELARRRRAAITSVFPSTTASAITTSYTGFTPLEHGVTGWYTYFGEAGCVTAALPFRSRGDLASIRERGVTPAQIYSAEPLFHSLAVRSIVVTSRDIVDSDYNLRHCEGAERRGYDTTERLVAEVEAAVKSGPERKFIYAYWPNYDQVSHRHGCESREAFAEFERIDHAFGELVKRLAGTESVVVATADHGFIDVAPHDCLVPPPAIASSLRFPLCGERRVAYCHVDAIPSFIDKARDWLGERADVLPSRQLVDEGWFGPGVAHPRIAERVGDVTLVMKNGYTVKDWLPGEARHLLIGNHGGTSEDEMTIPLIVENA